MTSAVGRAKATKSDPSIVCATGRGRSLGSKAVSIRRPRQLERASSLRQNDQSINSRDTVAGIEPGTTYRYTLKPTRAHTHSYTTSAMGRTATHSNQKQKQQKNQTRQRPSICIVRPVCWYYPPENVPFTHRKSMTPSYLHNMYLFCLKGTILLNETPIRSVCYISAKIWTAHSNFWSLHKHSQSPGKEWPFLIFFPPPPPQDLERCNDEWDSMTLISIALLTPSPLFRSRHHLCFSFDTTSVFFISHQRKNSLENYYLLLLVLFFASIWIEKYTYQSDSIFKDQHR